MLSKTILVLLIICAVLVQESEGYSRRRRLWKHVGKFFGNMAKTALKTKATAVLVGALGKRDADCAPALTPEETSAVVQQLEDVIDVSFAESDAKTDGALAGAELNDFLNTIGANDEREDFAEQN